MISSKSLREMHPVGLCSLQTGLTYSCRSFWLRQRQAVLMRDTGLPLLTACLHMCFECIFSVDKHGVQMQFTHRGYQSTPLTLINYHYCYYYLGRIIDFNIIKGKCGCSETPIYVHFWNIRLSLTQLCASANKALFYGPTVGCTLNYFVWSKITKKNVILWYFITI